MKLLLSFRHRKAVEPFVDLVQALCGRGHEVTIATHERDEKVPLLFSQAPALAFVTLPDGRRDEWSDVAELARHTRDVGQYLAEPYRDASKLRYRVFDRLLKLLGVPRANATGFSPEALLDLGSEAAARLERVLAQLERLTPPEPLTVRALEQHRPDAVLVTPLIHFGSTQVEVVKAARALGIPVGMLLFSWDNLSTKGALHVAPDHLFVWNERQRREAHELHRVDEARVTVTGAPRFDRFAALRSQVDGHLFRRSLGVEESTPVVLYLCSSRLVSEKEINFIRQWVQAIRRAPDEPLRRALLLVRPHPDLPLAEGTWMSEERTFRWPDFEPEPRVRTLFDDPRALMLTSAYGAQQMLFESIFHSVAVVGLNTSAEIEAAIVGRPVLTILTDASHADGQHTTLHFHYLTKTNGGFVEVARSLDEHVAALAQTIESPPSTTAIRERVAAFIRPAGWERAASDVLAEAIEQRMPGRVEASADRSSAVGGFTVPPVVSARGLDQETSAALEWLGARVSAGTVVYDLTAGTGEFARAAARQFGCTVIAFESNIAALTVLWQQTLAEGCDGLIVPLLLKPGIRSALYRERYDRFAPDASSLPLRTPTWREHDAPAGDEVIQPVMTAPLEWAMRRWKLPLPMVVRAVLPADARELIGAVESVLSEPRLTAVILSGDSRQRDVALRRLEAHGFSEAPAPASTLGILIRAGDMAARAVDSAARLQ